MSDGQYILLCEIDLGPESGDALEINVVLPTATVNVAYAGALIASGGVPAYTYDDTPSGSFPPGLVIDDVTGLVTGTPSATGYYEFTAAVTDSDTPPVTATKVVSIIVVSGIAFVGTFAPGEVGIAYSSGLSASGGVAPYTWTISSGSAPTSLTINSTTGVISGTPSAAGTFNLTVTATDSNGDAQDFPTSIAIALAVDLSTSTFPGGTVGGFYSAGPTTIGGVAPFTYSISSGAIPAGCTFSSSTGFVSGQPTTVATYNFDVTVLDVLGGTDTYSATVAITAGGGGGGIASFAAHDLSPLFTQTVTDPTGPNVDLAFTQITQAINLVLASPASGGSGNPTFRALVANDLPTVPISKGGTGQTTAQAAIDALAGSATKGDLLVYNGTHWVPHVHGSNSSFPTYNSVASDGITNAFVPYFFVNDLSTEILADNPQVYYKLNEAAGATTFVNFGSFGSSANITVTAACTPGFGRLYGASDDVFPKFFATGTAMSVSVNPTGVSIPNGDCSIECIVRGGGFPEATGTIALLALNNNASNTIYSGIYLGSTYTTLTTFYAANAMQILGQISRGVVLHLVLVNDASAKSLTFWVNGDNAGTFTYASAYATTLTAPRIFLASDQAGDRFIGTMGHAAFYYGLKLTEARIVAHAKAAGLY